MPFSWLRGCVCDGRVLHRHLHQLVVHRHHHRHRAHRHHHHRHRAHRHRAHRHLTHRRRHRPRHRHRQLKLRHRHRRGSAFVCLSLVAKMFARMLSSLEFRTLPCLTSACVPCSTRRIPSFVLLASTTAFSMMSSSRTSMAVPAAMLLSMTLFQGAAAQVKEQQTTTVKEGGIAPAKPAVDCQVTWDDLSWTKCSPQVSWLCFMLHLPCTALHDHNDV